MLSEAEKSQIFGNMLAKSRNDAGKTQRYMAQALHKSVNTIQNWESGISEPGYRTLEKWFDTLGLNMDSYILEYKYKDFTMTIDKSDLDTVKKCITMYINTQFSERDFLQLAYCMFGNTGSSWHEQLNMLTAHNHSVSVNFVSISYTYLRVSPICCLTYSQPFSIDTGQLNIVQASNCSDSASTYVFG